MHLKKKKRFFQNAKHIPKEKVPIGANIIGSHTFYELKKNENGTLKLKARIVPYGNEDKFRHEVTKDYNICPTTVFRILISIAVMKKWYLYKADVKAAFLQTGKVQRAVYVRPPRESSMKATNLWLRLSAAYGLVYSGAKWQNQSDQTFYDLGLDQFKHVQKLFYKNGNGHLVIIAAKVVDDILVAGNEDEVKSFLKNFHERFTLGTLSKGPGNLRFFGINIYQHEEFFVETNADDKLEALQPFALSRTRRKQSKELASNLEVSSFSSTNSSLG